MISINGVSVAILINMDCRILKTINNYCNYKGPAIRQDFRLDNYMAESFQDRQGRKVQLVTISSYTICMSLFRIFKIFYFHKCNYLLVVNSSTPRVQVFYLQTHIVNYLLMQTMWRPQIQFMARNFTIIVQNRLVPGTDSSVIYISKKLLVSQSN